MFRKINALTAITIIASSACLITKSSAQITLGQMVKQTMKESWADIEPLGQDKRGLYYLAIPYTDVLSGPMIADADYYLFLVDDKAELIKKNQVDFQAEGQRSRYEFTKEVQGKILVFTSVEDKKARTVSFYSYELDKTTLQLANPQKVIQLSFAEIKRDYERASFNAELSRDKSKLLISYALVDDDGSMLRFGYVILNSTLKELSKWSGNLDMTDGVYLFDQFRISNKGEVYLQTRYFKNEKAHDKNTSMKKTNILTTTRSMEYKKNYEHRIVKFEGNSATKIIPIPNKDKFYDVFDTEVTPDGNLLMIGFYSSLEEEKLPIGAVAVKVNAKTGVLTPSHREFTDGFEMPSDISIKNNGLTAGKDQYLKYRFIVSNIYFNKNGGYTLIGERNVMQTKRVQNTIYTVNHLDDLAVVDVSATGTVNAIHKVEKSQQAESLELFNASYFYTEHNNNKYIAFANMGKGSFRESVLVTIGANGKQTREVMFNTKDAEVTIKPKDCQFYNGNLMIYGNKNNRYVRWASRPL